MLSISAAYLIAGRKRSHGKLWSMGRKNQRYSFDTKMEVGIKSEKLIHKWARKWQIGGDAGLDPRMRRPTSTNADTNAETELERLRRENYRLRMERDVLRALKALRESKLDSSWD